VGAAKPARRVRRRQSGGSRPVTAVHRHRTTGGALKAQIGHVPLRPIEPLKPGAGDTAKGQNWFQRVSRGTGRRCFAVKALGFRGHRFDDRLRRLKIERLRVFDAGVTPPLVRQGAQYENQTMGPADGGGAVQAVRAVHTHQPRHVAHHSAVGTLGVIEQGRNAVEGGAQKVFFARVDHINQVSRIELAPLDQRGERLGFRMPFRGGVAACDGVDGLAPPGQPHLPGDRFRHRGAHIGQRRAVAQEGQHILPRRHRAQHRHKEPVRVFAAHGAGHVAAGLWPGVFRSRHISSGLWITLQPGRWIKRLCHTLRWKAESENRFIHRFSLVPGRRLRQTGGTYGNHDHNSVDGLRPGHRCLSPV